MGDMFPKEWSQTKLAEVVISQKGKNPLEFRSKPSNGFVPYLDIRAIETGAIQRYAEQESSHVSDGCQLFMVWDGARSGWVGNGQIGAVGSTIMALTPVEINTAFLKAYLDLKFDSINANTRGTGIPHVDPKYLWELDVPLPPLAEQQEIGKRLVDLLAQVDAIKTRLTAIPTTLQHFRQSTLAAAVSGKLTEQWRGESDYKRISKFFEYPSSWSLTTIGKEVAIVTSGSRGWAEFYSDTGSLFIRSQDINTDELVIKDAAFVVLPANVEGKRTQIKLDDLLVTITGANVTKCARVKDSYPEAYIRAI